MYIQKYFNSIGLFFIIGLFQIKDVEEVQYNDLSSLEKRPNIDSLNVFSREKVNNGTVEAHYLDLFPVEHCSFNCKKVNNF